MKAGKYIVLGIFLILVLLNIRKKQFFSNVERSIYNKVFNGIIKEISKGGREVPIFKIDDNEISLGGYGHNLADHLNIGDSIYKHKGNSIVFIYRLKEQDTVKVDIMDNSRNNIVP